MVFRVSDRAAPLMGSSHVGKVERITHEARLHRLLLPGAPLEHLAGGEPSIRDKIPDVGLSTHPSHQPPILILLSTSGSFLSLPILDPSKLLASFSVSLLSVPTPSTIAAPLTSD